MRALSKTLMMLLALLLAAAAQASAQSTTVVVVRHAEKADDSADPVLSEAGAARAAALARLLEHADVRAVLTTQFQRTALTGTPTARAHGVEVTQVPAGGPMQRHLDALAGKVKEYAGGTVLVVGHSNTVPLIVRALGGPDIGSIDDSEYGHVITLVIDGGETPRVRMIRATY